MNYFVEVSGRAFGPFPVATIKGWIDSGRVTSETRASTNKLEWKRADEFPELAPFFGVSVGAPGGAADADAAVWFLSMDRQTVFGPYRGSDVLQWIRDGRVKGDTLVWREGENSREISTEPYFALQFNAPSGGGGFGGFGASGGGADQAAAAAARPNAEPQEWYYSVDGIQGRGPYSITEILEFVEQGRASVDSVVWRQGENARKMRSEPAFKDRFRQTYTVPGIVTTPIPALNVTPLNKQLSFRYWAFLIAACCSILFSLIIFGYHEAKDIRPDFDALALLKLVHQADSTPPLTRFEQRYRFITHQMNEYYNKLFDDVGFVFLFFFYCAAVTVSGVFFFMFTYTFRKSIPPGVARTTPARAVGFLFIPFFRLYWYFVVFVGGVRDMNRGFKTYARVGAMSGEQPKYASEGAAIVVALVFLLAGIVGIFSYEIWVTLKEWNYLLYPVFLSLIIIFLLPLKNSATQLNRWRAESPNEIEVQHSNTVTLDDLVNS